MKNSILSFAALACCALLAGTATAQVGVGVRGGITSSTLRSESGGVTLTLDSRTGYYVGIPVEVRFPGPLGLQVEANLSQFGSKLNLDLGGVGSLEAESVYNYLTIPVLLKGGFVGESFELSAVAGPSFGYALSGKSIVMEVEETIDFDNPDATFKRGNVAAVFGVQAGLPVGGGKFLVDVRYSLGLNDIDDDDDAVATNRQFSAGLGYLFTFGV